MVLSGVASEVGMRNGLYVELSCAVGCGTTTACAAPWSHSQFWLHWRLGNLQAVRRGSVVRCMPQQQTVRRRRWFEISHNGDVATTSAASREEYVRRGRQLEYFTIGYNSLEGVTSIVAGLIAGSVLLVGFGLDSLIEVTSGATLLWRLRHDLDISRREQVERIALRTVGVCFVALALYIFYESSAMLIRHVPPERSIAGIVIAAISVIVMPLLARAKRRVARQIGSGAHERRLKTGRLL